MPMSLAMQTCIQLCWECRHTCQETLFNHCLSMGGAHVEQPHVRIMADCIQACQTCADFMTRGSAMHAYECAACAAICEACARSCEKIGGKEMKACADACRRCAEACRDMSREIDFSVPHAA